jgi:hypothetical protein
VLERHLHYSLMWEPSGAKVAASKEPAYASAPSWSWMSYFGPVTMQRRLDSYTWTSPESDSSWSRVKKDWSDMRNDIDGLDVNANIAFRHGMDSEITSDLAALVDCTIAQRGQHDIPGLSLEYEYVLRGVGGKTMGLLGSIVRVTWIWIT